MANIEVFRVEFESPQTTDVTFPVAVVVENHETISPWSWEDHKCTTSGQAGHKVDVTLTVETTGGQTVSQQTERVCAPVQSLLQPNARARFDVTLDDPGEYIIRADVEAYNVDGYDSSEPYRVVVEESADVIDEGGQNSGGSEDTAATGFPEFDTGDGGSGSVSLPGGGDPLSNPWVLGGLALVVLIILRPYADLGAAVAD